MKRNGSLGTYDLELEFLRHGYPRSAWMESEAKNTPRGRHQQQKAGLTSLWPGRAR